MAYIYNPGGTPQTVTHSPIRQEYAYDLDKNLTGLTVRSGDTLLSQVGYAYDGNGNETKYLLDEWGRITGIVGGYGNGLFGSNDTITREQMAVILYRFAQAMGMDTTQGGMSVREYQDFDNISDYAVAAIQWAVNAGVMQGYDGNLMPDQPCTRAQIVTMLYRLLGK